MTSLRRPPARPLQLARSLLFQAVYLASIPIWGPVVLLPPSRSPDQRFTQVARWSRFVIGWLRLSCGVRYTVEGLDRVPPGPAVILVKHQSTWETLFLQRYFSPQVWVLKAEILKFPVVGQVVKSLDAIAIDRSAGRAAIKQLLRQGRERLSRGYRILIYPEGTRVDPGQRGRYNMGGAMLAVQNRVPVIPVAHNAGFFWPRRGLLKHPGTVQVVIGEPIASDGLSPQELNARAEEWIESTVARLGTSGTPR